MSIALYVNLPACYGSYGSSYGDFRLLFGTPEAASPTNVFIIPDIGFI